jgi:hypothetical protein
LISPPQAAEWWGFPENGKSFIRECILAGLKRNETVPIQSSRYPLFVVTPKHGPHHRRIDPAMDSSLWVQDPENQSHRYRYIQENTPPGVVQRLGGGSSCLVGLFKDGTVLKYPLVKGEEAHTLHVERTIFQDLGQHDRIIRYLGNTSDGLRLELAACGSISDFLSQKHNPSLGIRLKWSRQAAEGVAFVHSRGVVHCDIHVNNLLLDENLDVKLSDFQGTYKDLDGYAMESSRYFLPRPVTRQPNVTTDLFALGTAIYRIMTGMDPLPNLTDEEVEERYSRREFPDVSSVMCGEVIENCWSQKYEDAGQLVRDLMDLELSVHKRLIYST